MSRTPSDRPSALPSARPTRRQLLRLAALSCVGGAATAQTGPPSAPSPSAALPVRVGLDAEFGLINSTSAQAIELGLRIALAEINAAGGVLGGRPLELLTRDNHSMPARAVANLRELAGVPEMVAVFGGKFSPVMIDAVPVVHELKLPLLAVWSSADPIVEHGRTPSYVFRLALRDSLAMPRMLGHALQRRLDPVGLLLANTGWGRSNLAAAERHLARLRKPAIAAVAWFNWGEKSLLQRYQSLLEARAEAVLLVANDDDAAGLVQEVARLPAAQRVPLICHQGVTGGRFAALAGTALQSVDLSVLQTFSFFNAEPQPLARFMKAARAATGVTRIDEFEAPAGVAHAYDMLHLLALAIRRAGSTERSAVRDALETLPPHRGLIKQYRPAFSATRHEALGTDELLMARYRADGVLVPTPG